MDAALRQALSKSALASYDLTRLGISQPRALEAIASELAGRLALSEPARCEKRWRSLEIAGTQPADYAECVIEAGPLGTSLAGIRHANGNVERPFIDLWASVQPKSPDQLHEAIALLAERFRCFRPKHAALWLHPESALIDDSTLAGGRGLNVVAGERDRLLHSQDMCGNSAGRAGLSLSPPEAGYYQWYQANHKAFHAAAPELVDWVPGNSEAQMEDCRRDGLLYEVHRGGEQIGLIAGVRSPFLGQPGIYMMEIILHAEQRGKGLAVPVQRAFIEQAAAPGEIIWGTIDNRNQASLRTALRVGRRIVRAELFVPIAEPVGD